MAVTIGSARIDENGRVSGGKNGDQNGREVSTQPWYLHAKGWRVFRCRDRVRALRIAEAMRSACENDRIGYSQVLRNLLYGQIAPLGFDPKAATTPTATDCSALVRVCCAYAGITLSDFTTASEAATLLRSGAFDELTDERYTKRSAYLRAGDILVTRVKGHTAVVLTDGAKTEKAQKVTLKDGSWHLRSGEGQDYESLTCLKGGEYTVLERGKNGWVRVAAQIGGSGWVGPGALR